MRVSSFQTSRFVHVYIHVHVCTNQLPAGLYVCMFPCVRVCVSSPPSLPTGQLPIDPNLWQGQCVREMAGWVSGGESGLQPVSVGGRGKALLHLHSAASQCGQVAATVGPTCDAM